MSKERAYWLKSSRAEVIEAAVEIARSYMERDLTLTVRQLYYKLVGVHIVPDEHTKEKPYKFVVDLVTEAHLSGALPFEWIIDRGREVRHGQCRTQSIDVEDALESAAAEISDLPRSLLWIDRWWGQKEHVSVWVEKDALAGVFEKPCEEHGVSWFPCKGYPSLSALYSWCEEVNEVVRALGDEAPETATILYFGDHDPDGLEIPEAAERRLHEIAETCGFRLPTINLVRVALTMDQIREHRCPEFWAKVSSARYKSYVKKAGTDKAWELDALDPEVLRDLVTAEVSARFDDEVRAPLRRLLRERREELQARIADPDWLNGLFAEER